MSHVMSPTIESVTSPLAPTRTGHAVMTDSAAPEASPVTITAQEMSRLTGVARERLRTWERRHGFPVAERSRNNVRRYLVEDVRHVAAVAQLATNGVPLSEAIETVLSSRDTPGTLESLGAALDHAPTPAIAVSGPAPLTVAWVNGMTRAGVNTPAVGSDVSGNQPLLGYSACEAIRGLLAQDEAVFRVITHNDWVGSEPVSRRSVAWRLTSGTTGQAVVVLLQLPEAVVAAPAAPVRDYGLDASRWATGIAAGRRALQDRSGLSAAQQALRSLVEETAATDGFLALFQGDEIRTATSVRGSVTPRTAERAACGDLEQAVRDCEVDWLGEETITALRLDSRYTAAVVPLVVSGEALGVVVLTFATPTGLADAARELLLGFGAMMAAVVLRERGARALASIREASSARTQRTAGSGRVVRKGSVARGGSAETPLAA